MPRRPGGIFRRAPFLYEVRLATGADAASVRFGLRSYWIDLRTLRSEPYFEEYVQEAFAPVGLMLDFWDDTLAAGGQRELSIVAINDLPDAWSGHLRLRLLRGTEVVSEQTQPCMLVPFGDRRQSFTLILPTAPGDYTIEVALVRPDAPPTRSLRDVRVPIPSPSADPRRLP